MAEKFQAPRGTYDLLPEAAQLRQQILATARELLEGAGYGQIDTPVFEDTDLFALTVGEATDIAVKEMYTFTDRSDRSLTLRPEGSAPVCRAYVEHGMHKLPQPVKLWYSGPMFRYEAPQSGRFRQHTQVGAEALGSDDPAVDAELIDLLAHLFARLDIGGVRLHLNSVGDDATRTEYSRELSEFLLATDVFDPRQRERIEVNPMRAFDWSGEQVEAVTAEAPKIIDRLNDTDREHLDGLRALLDGAGIDYLLDPRLVRGLDYYTRTVFEFRSDALGAQSGIGGGGRYDRLVEKIGGGPTPAVGWGAGLERIAQAMAVKGSDATGPSFLFAVTEPQARQRIFRAISELRDAGVDATMDLGGRSLKGQLKQASRAGARWVVIVGPDEWSEQKVAVRDMDRSEQRDVSLDHLRAELLALAGKRGAGR